MEIVLHYFHISYTENNCVSQALDLFDSLLSKRLEERIHQLQIFRQQLELIQLRNEREIIAAKIKNDKIMDKLKRLIASELLYYAAT